MKQFSEYLQEQFNKYGIKISEEQAFLFFEYKKLLLSWNKKFNLTAITEEEEVVEKHFIDSVLPFKEIKENSYIVDVGSGAGFPAIPLKIINPSLKFVLIDSLNKRVEFLNNVIKELKLNNVKAVHIRCEEAAFKEEYREKFDYSVARAVSKLNTLVEYCLPFLKKGGVLLAYKGDALKEIEEANKAIHELGGVLLKTNEYSLSGAKRNIVFIKKEKETPKKYPRKGNKPKINPI